MDTITGKQIYDKIICHRVMLSTAKKKADYDKIDKLSKILDKIQTTKYQVIL